MKLLTSEQQTELQQLFTELEELQDQGVYAVGTGAQITYWKNEMKPKRVRRLPKESA